MQMRITAIGYNLAAAQMDDVTGYISPTPRMQVPDMPRAPITYNNINVDNSVVGAINTGEAQKIDVNLTVLEQAGSRQAHDALSNFTQTVIDNQELDTAKKNEVLELVRAITDQSVAKAEDRKPSVIKALCTQVTSIAGAVGAVATAWQHAEPIVKSLFGLQ